MKRLLLLFAVAAAGCVVESSRPPVSAGEGVTVDPATQTVSIDSARVPVADACRAGQIPVKSADGWACAEVSSLTNAIPPPDSCAPGQVVAKTLEGWSCVERIDETVPSIASCPTGTFVKKTAAGWTCAAPLDPAVTPVVPACEVGHVVTKTATGWSCAPAIDPASTPVVGACAPGLVVRRTATGWDCAPAVDVTATPVVPGCESGKIIVRTDDGWTCSDLPPDPDHTPVVESCAAGEYPRRTATGWVCGPLVGNLSGNVSGSLIGNVTGHVTGDVSGTADNVRGTVGVENGGTGLNAFSPRALLAGDATGGALAAIPPGLAGALLSSTGTQWIPSAPAALDLVTRSSGPLTIYVRTDGSDTNCNGTANVAAGSGACAVQTLQKAVDLIPDVISHPMTVRLGGGTHRTTSAGGVAVSISKLARSGGFITIIGEPGVVVSGASQGAPSVPVAAIGLAVGPTSGALRVQDITFDRFAVVGVVVDGAAVTLQNVQVTNSAGGGISCRASALCVLSGSVSINGAVTGLHALGNAQVSVPADASLTIANTSGLGVLAERGGAFSSAGILTIADLSLPTIYALRGGVVVLTGTSTLSATADHVVVATERSTVVAGGTVTATNRRQGSHVFYSGLSSYVALVPTGELRAICTSPTNTYGLSAVLQSTLAVSGAGNVTVTGCGRGLYAAWSSSLADFGGGGDRTFDNVGSRGYATYNSTVATGGFADLSSNNCENSSVCN